MPRIVMILIGLAGGMFPAAVESGLPERMQLIATAYYGPLAGQSAYATDSFWGDIRLNGRGTHTFSGKRPKVGHAAADLSLFPIGTVLRIVCPPPGIPEIVIVEDTGGAMRGQRLDIFVGHGYPALTKAKLWGKRSITLEILSVPAEGQLPLPRFI